MENPPLNQLLMLFSQRLFLDFDGVMDTAYYDHILSEDGLPTTDRFGVLFDPDCVTNLQMIVEKTGADNELNCIFHTLRQRLCKIFA